MYDEAIEVHEDSDEDVSGDENANGTDRSSPHPKPGSPMPKPLSARPRQPPPLILPQSFSRVTNVKDPGEESRQLSMQDIVPVPRPSSSNHRGIGGASSTSLGQSQHYPFYFTADTPRPKNVATEMSQSSSIEQKQGLLSSGMGRKSQQPPPAPPPTGKVPSRPQSAISNEKSPQNQKQESSDDYDDDYDATNMAQVEGILRNYPSRITLASKRGAANATAQLGLDKVAGHPSYSDSDSEFTYNGYNNNSGDSDLENSEMLEEILNSLPHSGHPEYPYEIPEEYLNDPLPYLGHVTKSGPVKTTCSGGYANFLPPDGDIMQRKPRMSDEYLAVLPEVDLSSDAEADHYLESRRKMWEYNLDLKRMELQAERLRRRYSFGYTPQGPPENTVYCPNDYVNLPVHPEIKGLFQYITKYQIPPINSQNDVKLLPFLPEYYPSVGDIDAFIKVKDPEVKEDGLGLKCLDEPSPLQSDPSVLDLKLRALSKHNSVKAIVVKKVENVSKNSHVIDSWIKDISDLHKSKPSPTVFYSRPMPDVDSLMQEWPPEVEEVLKSIPLPPPDLNCDLATYVDIVCNLLDIPVYGSRIESLHVLFNLYATQKELRFQLGPLDGNTQRVMTNDPGTEPSSAGGVETREDNFDRLQLL